MTARVKLQQSAKRWEHRMNRHYANSRKIDPSQGAFLGDGTPNDSDRIEIGPTQLAFAEWAAAGLELPNLAGRA
jgi:Xaa-Pro dipeptidase